MKAVSWAEAFCKLKEWEKRGSLVAVGEVRPLEWEGKTTPTFFGDTSRLTYVDDSIGAVILDGAITLSLVDASFRFSDFSDSPFAEADLGIEQFESQLEAAFPDGRVVVFAQEWPV